MDNNVANHIWNGLKTENFNLLRNLKECEQRKMSKTIPLDQELLSSSKTIDLPNNTAAQTRRFHGLHRLLRKLKLFRRKRGRPDTTTTNESHQLDWDWDEQRKDVGVFLIALRNLHQSILFYGEVRNKVRNLKFKKKEKIKHWQ